MTVKEIEKAISRLPADKFSALRSWFDKADATRWDKRFEKDIKKGKLDMAASKARMNFHKGKCREL